MLKIALIGYGAMGNLIESISKANGCQVVGIIDPKLGKELTQNNLADATVAIDFSVGSSVYKNAKKVLSFGKKLVIGVTGWEEQFQNVKDLTQRCNGGLIYGSNFSIGMNIFFQLTAFLAKKMNKTKDYDVYGLEKHHTRKIDAPSGTAISLSKIILNSIDRKKRLIGNLNRKIEDDEFQFTSVRVGDISGDHTIDFVSNFDNISITHSAKSREGFAVGACLAAHFISDKNGFFNFTEQFNKIVG